MNKENVITLDNPVKRGEQVIEQVTLMKPNAGTLRGVSLAAVANSEVDALIKVLPRMTAPMLTEQEVAALELPDLVALAGKVVGFLVAELGAVTFPKNFSVDDLMADVAVIFHWPPSELYPMSLTELITWREKALRRSGNTNE
ncbi:gpE+E' [Escherichia phage Wphi]|uniref:GpE+E n=2 Tax=root TaxID=1 RepID=Q7Y4C9_9CAUD|nr:tail protein [Escherichia phage Wphi]AAN28243.1 gpE+E' [Escherichia phage Wphi]